MLSKVSNAITIRNYVFNVTNKSFTTTAWEEVTVATKTASITGTYNYSVKSTSANIKLYKNDTYIGGAYQSTYTDTVDVSVWDTLEIKSYAVNRLTDTLTYSVYIDTTIPKTISTRKSLPRELKAIW